MPGSGRCSIFQSQTGMTAVADLFGDLQIGLSGVLEEFGKLRSDIRILVEQKLLEHHPVYADHFFELGSEKVHENTRLNVGSDCAGDDVCVGRQAAVVSYTDGASQEPSIRNRIAGSVLAEMAFGGGTSCLTSSR